MKPLHNGIAVQWGNCLFCCITSSLILFHCLRLEDSFVIDAIAFIDFDCICGPNFALIENKTSIWDSNKSLLFRNQTKIKITLFHHKIESKSVMKNKYCFNLMNEHQIFNFFSLRTKNDFVPLKKIIIINKRKGINGMIFMKCRYRHVEYHQIEWEILFNNNNKIEVEWTLHLGSVIWCGEDDTIGNVIGLMLNDYSSCFTFLSRRFD